MRVHASKFAALFVSVLLGLFSLFAHPAPTYAVSGLDLVRDFVGTNAPNVSNITHDIYFVLPIDAQQVTPSEWVLINFPNYTNINASNISLSGHFGTPTVTVVGTTVRITDISLLAGTGLNIIGISATNPLVNLGQQVVISITEDAAGATIRNQVITLPLTQGGNVVVSATVQSGLSAVNISGHTSPNSFVVLTESSAVIGTTLSSGVGFFSFPVTGLNPGAHTFSISSTDEDSRSTSVSTLNLFLISGSLTTVTGILLSPSIEINVVEIDPGQTVTVSGAALPNAQINIFLEAPLRSYVATTDASGDWTFTISGTETSTLTPGQYQVYTNVQDSVGTQSITSPTVNFQVKSPDSSNPAPACNISHGDLNCDTRTNLVDFSILLFHWQTNHKVADINSDNKVNLTDFSIMMFYFVR